MSQRALITETRPSINAIFFFWRRRRIFSQPPQCKLIVYTFLNLSFVKYHANEADSARRVWPGKVHFPPFFARGSQRSSLKSFRRDPGFQSGAGWMDLVAQGNFPETEEDTTKQIIAFTRSPFKETHNIWCQYYLIYDLIHWLCCSLMKRKWPELQSGAEPAAQAGGGNTDGVSCFPYCVRTWSLKFSDTFRRKAGAVSGTSLPKCGEASTWTAPSWTCDNLAGLKSQHLRGKPHRWERRWNFHAFRSK